MRRFLLWSVALIVLLVALPLAVLFLVNLSDEPLSPAARAALEGDDRPKAGARNGYAMAQGLLAPEGADILAEGEKRIATLVAADREGRKPAEEPPGLPIAELLRKPPCDPVEADCLAAGATPEAIASWRARAKPVGNRCDSMLATADSWSETYQPTWVYSPTSNLGARQFCQRWWHAGIAERWQGGEREQALQALAAELAFQRRTAEGSGTLIGKMLSVNAIGRSFSLLGEALQRAPELRERKELLASALRPLSPGERSLAAALRGEFRSSARVFADLKAGRTEPESGARTLRDALEARLLQPQASANRLWPFYEAAIRADAADPSRLQAAIAETRRIGAALQPAGWSPDRAYDPVGKYLGAIAAGSAFDRYTMRIWMLETFRRLVALQAALAPGADPDAVAAARALEYLHPLTGKPVAFDPGTRTVSHEIIGGEPVRQAARRLVGERRVSGQHFFVLAIH